MSGSDTFGDVDAKVRQYLDSGVRLVWLIDPVMRTVAAHAPNARPHLLSAAIHVNNLLFARIGGRLSHVDTFRRFRVYIKERL